MNTLEAAIGHWPRILAELGEVDPSLLDGRHHACPACGGRDRFRFDDKDGRGTFYCSGCGAGDGMKLLRAVTGHEFAPLAKRIDKLIGRNPGKAERRMPTYADKLRSIAKPSKRSAYLASRGLEVAPGLLFARGVEYWDGERVAGSFDAMLAPVTRGGRWLTFHATYLHRGRKAPVDPCRKILPAHGSVTGAGVELYPAAEFMGVAEGVETAIAAKMLHGTPTHAALNTSMLAKWEPPPVAKSVWIYADNDESAAGHAAAWALCHRLRMKGLRAEVVMPPDVGTDWADVWLAQSRAAA
jgi:putative DNA primase/helicase